MIKAVAKSMPSSARRRRAVAVILFFAGIGSLIRFSRPDFGLLPMLAPLDFHGTSPNFLVCAGLPFNAFCFKTVITLPSYAKTAVGSAVGLSLYEVVQIYMPRRTFDLYDIAASFLGALLSVLLAGILFFMQTRNGTTTE